MLAHSVLAAPAEGIPHPIDEAVKLVSPARAAGNRFVRECMLSRSLPAAHTSSVCRAQHLLRRAYHTRMIGRWNLPVLHAMLETILSGSACSCIMCPPSSIENAMEPTNPAYAAESRLVKGRMLSRSLPAAHTSSVCRAQHLLRRAHRTRLIGRRNLLAPYALLRRAYPIDGAVELVSPARDAGKHFVRECMLAYSVPFRTHSFSTQTYSNQLTGYGGLPPCSRAALDLLPTPCVHYTMSSTRMVRRW